MKPQPTFNLSVTINGNPWSGDVPVEETLLEFLRLRLRLTGTKRSCESEVCGACTVLVDNRPVSSCNYLAFEAHGRSVLTIEGVAQGDDLDPLQEGIHPQHRCPVWLLYARANHGGESTAHGKSSAHAGPNRRVANRQHLSLRRLWRYCPIDSRSGRGISQAKELA